MGKDEIIAERAQLKTVEAIQIEIAIQRRELASKDSELEMETRQVEQARALAKELKRALDRFVRIYLYIHLCDIYVCILESETRQIVCEHRLGKWNVH